MLERTGPDAAKAEIKVKMGAMSMKFSGLSPGKRAQL